MMRPSSIKGTAAASRRHGSARCPPISDSHPADKTIRIAYLPDPVKVLSKPGYPKPSVRNRLQQECGMQFTQITCRDVKAGKLGTEQFDLLCLPGGYAPNFEEKLGEKGRAAIEKFVSDGGGFVGVCAGAYVGSNWGYGLLDVDLPYIDRWARGKTDYCALGFTSASRELLGESAKKNLDVRYCNGPLMVPCDAATTTVHATFETELRGRRNKYRAEMKGTAAIVSGVYGGAGGGKVVLISPHLETSDERHRTIGAHALFRQLFRFAAGVLDPPPAKPPTSGLVRTASGRAIAPGEFALTRQRSGCSCYAEEEQDADECIVEVGNDTNDTDTTKEVAQLEPEPEPEPEAVVPHVQPAARDKRDATSSGLQQQPVPPPPTLMADGYSVRGLPYVESAGGPILFTAPHGLMVYRGGGDGERRRVHLRERWSTEIALKLAAAAPATGGAPPASFMVWNHKTAKKKDSQNLDPNYLTAEQQPRSPWHRALCRFKQRHAAQQQPLFHIDVHGKMDRKRNLDLDVGMGPMEEHWDEDGMELLKEHFVDAFVAVFTGVAHFRSRAKGSVGRMPFTVEVDPRLSGYWGSDTVMTMSHQAIAAGIPAVQLEVPYSMREQLMRNQPLFDRFATAIYSAYDEVVATGRVGVADGSVVGPAVDLTALNQDPAPQRVGRQTIALMLEECAKMDTAAMGREKMI